MEIKLITGATTHEACKNTIKQIDPADLDTTNLVVVPDSFSMQAESLIFDVLDIKSTLNTEVVGISRLASKILRNNNIPFERISGIEEVFCIFKAVKENEDQFKYFHKCDVDFCVKILEIIKQFKACKIKSDQIKPVGDQLLDNKMSDLKCIYESYDQLLGEKLDLSKLLDFFIEKSENDLNLSKINLYFVNFDSFSVDINSFICKLATKVNKVYIGMARHISPANAFIYEDDILKKTTKFAKENNVLVEVENFSTDLKDQHLAMVKNLFAFKVEEGQNDYFLNVVAKNKQDEVEFVAKYIKNEIVCGARFKDFAIAVSNEKYLDNIKTTFTKYDIAVYCDDAVDLSQTILGKYLLKILNIAKLGFNMQNLQYLINFPLKNFKDGAIKLSEIFYYNIQDENEFLERYPEYEKLINQIKNLKCCKKIAIFSEILKDLIDYVDFDEILRQITQENLFKKESENLQSKELLEKVFEKLTSMAGEEELELLDFESLLLLALKSIKVETIPSYVDAVYVGDATTSYFEDVDTLFVLGTTANALPRNKNDTGIIDDEDIKKLRLEFALEPEIKVLNRRSRLKIFEMLQHAKNKLIVCTPISDEGQISQRASFVNDLLSMFGQNVLHTLSLEDFDIAINNLEDSIKKFLFYVGCKQNLLNSCSKLKSEGKLPIKLAGTLNSLLKTYLKNDDKFGSLDSEKLKKQVYSASQLESYHVCPFRYFVDYVLKLEKKENIEPNKRIFGTFEHELLKIFVENFDTNSKNIDEFLNKNVYKIAETIYDKKVLSIKHFVDFLFNESRIILRNVVHEQKYSKFRPIALEEKIFTPISDGKFLMGYIDRVDRADNYFRIIDYKTGKTENLKTELYYGKKLQLFLYANAINKKSGLDCAGVYYFDCKTKYAKSNEKTTLLNGLTKKDDEVVNLSDQRLFEENYRSDLIGITRKVGEDHDFSFKYGNTIENLQDLMFYAKEIAVQAINEIEEGYVLQKPYDGACINCPYNSVCRRSEFDGSRQIQTVKEFKRKNNED